MATIHIKRDGNVWYFELYYPIAEYTELKAKYESLGLQETETANGWGRDIAFKYWREGTNEQVLNQIKIRTSAYVFTNLHMNVIDDINREPIGPDFINIAIFRVIPKENSSTRIAKIPLKIIPNTKNIRDIAFALKIFFISLMVTSTGDSKQFKITITEIPEQNTQTMVNQ
jgi:hypothetical protein